MLSRNENKGRIMYANCPDCATGLDQHSVICPACRWDPILSDERTYGAEPDGTFTDRYSTTDLESVWATAAAERSPISRRRATILVGLVAMATLYWIVLTLLGTV